MTDENSPAAPPTRRSLRITREQSSFVAPRETSTTPAAPAARPAQASRPAPTARGKAVRAFSIFAAGMVGILTVGMTLPAQAAWVSGGGGPSTAQAAPVTVESIAAVEAQVYAGPTSVSSVDLQRGSYSAEVVSTGRRSALSSSTAATTTPLLQDGGLTLDQAQAVIADYVSTPTSGSIRKGELVLDTLYPDGSGPGDCGYGRVVDKLDNCVGFVTYFMNVYTSFDRYVFANGGQEATNMAAVLGRSTSSTPSAYSVASESRGGLGHTFVVLGIHDGNAIIAEAACGLTDGWPRARAVPLSQLHGDTFVSVADLLLPEPRTLAQLIG
ncbi:hypothetical protein [uncultured Microbacterium sp.]|uniref:hypothetical protein n=1 Tax=uncultured Microbacterium sp. TaxID=191216 RepID=UPI0025F2776F|nr:hypothetical protein [uncultured Microbacterium sp.]